jgi:hypothetical protein
MRLINPSRIPWDEYLAMHLREIAVGLVLAVILLCTLPFVEMPSGTTLTGRVMSQGKPVVFGTVTVLTSDHRTYSVPINADGTYVLKGLPSGAVQVAVTSPNPRSVAQRQTVETEAVAGGREKQSPGPKPASGGHMSGLPAAGTGQGNRIEGVSIAATGERGPAEPTPARRHVSHEGWFRIPGRYANPATSGIGTEVRRGRTTLDLSLD